MLLLMKYFFFISNFFLYNLYRISSSIFFKCWFVYWVRVIHFVGDLMFDYIMHANCLIKNNKINNKLVFIYFVYFLSANYLPVIQAIYKEITVNKVFKCIYFPLSTVIQLYFSCCNADTHWSRDHFNSGLCIYS